MSGTDLLLHGFAGTGRSWDPVIQAAGAPHWRPNAPDLPGHGSGGPVAPGAVPGLAASLAGQFGPVGTLAGYSMGGRIALQMALDQPGCAQRLVLVSMSPGIDDPADRARRSEADHELAARFEEASPEELADLWLSGPLFAGDAPQVQELAREQIRASEPAGLAAALREFGPGGMEPLWDRLPELRVPVTVVTGERDTRYREIGERIAALIPDADAVVVSGAGHALPREAPGELAALIAPACG